MSLAQQRAQAEFDAQKQRFVDLEGAIRNRPAVPPELQEQYSQMQGLGREITSAPISAPPREINGVRGGLQTLGLMLNQTRDPRSGQYDLFQAGVGALLAQLVGDKAQIGNQVARIYDQPVLDAKQKRMGERYDTQNRIIQSQLPFTRSAQDNDVEARKVGIQGGQLGIASAQGELNNAVEMEKLNRDRYAQHFDPTSMTNFILDKMTGRLAGAHQIRGGAGGFRKPDDIRQDASLMHKIVSDSMSQVGERDKLISRAVNNASLAEKLRTLPSAEGDPELSTFAELFKPGNEQKRAEKIAALEAEAEALWGQADSMANAIATQGNAYGYEPFKVTPWKEGAHWPKGHVALDYLPSVIQMMLQKQFSPAGDSNLTYKYGTTR